MDKVSLIIPIYNVEDYLEKCLNSLIGQTYENVELILINDGSTDRSLKIAEKYAEVYKQIKLINQKNGGLSNARNTGIGVAEGEYIFFVDSDDWLELNAVQEIVTLMKRDELDLCLFGANSYLSDEKGLQRQFGKDYDYSLMYKGVYRGKELFKMLYINREFKASACMYAVKREIFVKYGLIFKEGIIHEDELFTPFVFYFAKRAELTQKKLYNRRIRKSSIMTDTKAIEHMKGYGSVFLGLAKCPGNQDNDKDVAESYFRNCVDNLQQSLNYYVLLNKEERKKAALLLKTMLIEKKKCNIHLSFIYYMYLMKRYIVKNYTIKKGKKRCI